jgi:hypothetical protein
MSGSERKRDEDDVRRRQDLIYSGPPPAEDRSTFVKGRPDWLNDDQCTSPVTNHIVPIYTSWASRLIRRDFYRICYGVLRFNSESAQPLHTWIRETEARIAQVRKDAAARVPMPDMDEYVTLELSTHKPLSRKMLELITEADKASAWRFSAGDMVVQDVNQTADSLCEPFSWVKNRQTVIGSSGFRTFNPGTHIVERVTEVA